MNFRTRVTPSREFESYTPNELGLKQLTVDNRLWEKEIERVLGRSVQGEYFDLHFRRYINKRFPLATVDVDDFSKYVLEEERKRGYPSYSEYTKTWHASKPEGQRHFAYPRVDHRDEPESYTFQR